MFYQEALPKLRFLSRVKSLLTRHWRKIAATFEKVGAYFCMGAYKRDVVVVIKMGAYIHGVLILCGYLLSRFYGTLPRNYLPKRGWADNTS